MEENFIDELAFMASDGNPMVTRSANQWALYASALPPSEPLFEDYWSKGEMSCFFADSNTGKSIMAMQVARDLALKGMSVNYFDFELSARQFLDRYSSASGVPFYWPDNLHRTEYHPEHIDPTSFKEENVIDFIESKALEANTPYIIIDNINTLTTRGQDGEAALKLMSKIRALKMKHGWSIMVVAHTPKRDLSHPITDNDLAGSKNLFNVFDSVFAMGRCAGDQELRYLKQLKCRSAAITHGKNNVAVYRIVPDPELGFLHFDLVTCCPETDLLEDEANPTIVKAKAMRAQNASYRKMSEELGVPVTTLHRWLKKEQNVPPTERNETA